MSILYLEGKKMRNGLLGAAAIIFIMASSSWAAVITYAGEAANVGAVATIQYTADGYDLYATAPLNTPAGQNANGPFSEGTRLTKLPSYVGSITAPSADRSYTGYFYYAIDNPSGGQVEGGYVSARSNNSGVESDLVSINLNAVPPPVFYVGFLTHLGGNSNDYPDDVRLRQNTGGGGDSGLIATSPVPNGGTGDVPGTGIDVYFFKVSGAASGDSLTFSGIENQPNQVSANYLLMQAGVLFPGATVPEPGSLVFLVAAGALPLARRRRRRNK